MKKIEQNSRVLLVSLPYQPFAMCALKRVAALSAGRPQNIKWYFNLLKYV